jgi:glycosyltransferase involved in cell wall biosynthesis
MKVLVVSTGGLSGIVPPIIENLRRDYGEVHVVCEWLPKALRYWLMLKSFRLPKSRWRRKWMHYLEKTPFAFKKRTEIVNNKISSSLHDIDFIVCFGALHTIDIPVERPMFLVCDSTRALSKQNEYDEQCHFEEIEGERLWMDMETLHYKKARKIFVGNGRVRDSLIQDYGIEPSKIVVTGFGAGLRESARIDKQFDSKTVLFIGKGDFEKKGGGILLDAFKKVTQRIPTAELHVVGQDRIPHVAGVTNHGFISDRDRLRELMVRANVFVLPSLVDRNPLTVIEAMAASTPCIVSDYGAMPELVGDAGYVVPRNQAGELADAISKLLTEPDTAKKMGERGRERYEQIYNWEKIWAQIAGEINAELEL